MSPAFIRINTVFITEFITLLDTSGFIKDPNETYSQGNHVLSQFPPNKINRRHPDGECYTLQMNEKQFE